MSEGSLNRARLRMRSLEDVKQRLGVRAICCDVRYLACDERISSLGNAISRDMEDLAVKVPGDISDRNLLADLAKAASLKSALEEQEFVFLREAAQKYVCTRDLRTIEQARELANTGNVNSLSTMKGDIASALANLSSAVCRAHSELANVEMKVVTDAALCSLTEMGYETCVKERDNDLLIRGVQKDLSIAMRVTEKNELHMDMAGFAGNSCTGELDRLYEALEKHGIDCEVIERHHHGKQEGGGLAREVIREVPFSFNPLEPRVNRDQRGTLLKLRTLKQKITRR